MGTAKRERQKANRQLRLEQIAQESRRKKTRTRVIQAAIVIPLLFLAVYALVFLVGDDSESTSTTTAPVATEPTSSVAPVAFEYGTGECAPAEKPAEPVRTFTDAPQQCIDAETTYSAVVTTNKGEFTIELDSANSPGTVNNFVNLARFGYYDGTGCHRIITDFAVQCGRPGEDETAPGYTIPDELPAAGEYTEAVVAMANTGAPNSGGGQFFIIVGEAGAALDPAYSILGVVTDGYDTTVAALEALADPEASNGVPPTEQVDITSIEITEA